MSGTPHIHELCCVIVGDPNPFLVSADDSDIYIADLKEMIKEKSRLLESVYASSLTLWKPRGVIPAGPPNTLAQRLGDLQLRLSEIAEELDPVDTVAYSFPPQASNSHHIDVIVQIPASTPQNESPSKRRHLADIFIPPWLEEVHSKIWGRNDLEPELFRTVEVTRAHYDELQRRLKEQHPDRDTPTYDGRKHDVRSVKLDVLRLVFPAANSPRHPDDNEDRVDDDDVPEASDDDESGMDVDEPEASNDGGSTADTIFPFTLCFLDLSTLGLRARVSHRLPSPLFLREEYNHISRLIEDEPVNSHGSVIVSGQPGTGKTAYLHLRVIQSMIEGRSFLYQGLDRTVYHINENGVQAIQSWSSDEIVAFVDGDMESYEPSLMLLDDRVQIILASTPEGANGKWIKQAGDVKVIATELWSPHELFLAGIFLHPLDILPELLIKSTSYFGYNPRRCFNSAYSVKLLEAKKEVVRSRITKQSNMVQLLYSTLTGDSNVSHSIFEISPKYESRLLAQCKFGSVSRWALKCFLEGYEAQQATAAADYRYISKMPETASLWGHVFEGLVLNYLDGIDAEHEFPIRGLTIQGPATWTYRGPIPRSDFLQKSDFVEEITNSVRNESPLHLVPSIRNFPAVDSIVYDPNEVLTCIQITVSRQHPIHVSGLGRIQGWLERGTRLADLRPSEDRPWRFIFIVPSVDEASFELQQLKGDSARGEWAGKVHQYVLGLDLVNNQSSV